MKTERTAFPKSGDLLAVLGFITHIPPDKRNCVYVSKVQGDCNQFNFALFPSPVTVSVEQIELMKAIEALTKLAISPEKPNPTAQTPPIHKTLE